MINMEKNKSTRLTEEHIKAIEAALKKRGAPKVIVQLDSNGKVVVLLSNNTRLI